MKSISMHTGKTKDGKEFVEYQVRRTKISFLAQQGHENCWYVHAAVWGKNGQLYALELYPPDQKEGAFKAAKVAAMAYEMGVKKQAGLNLFQRALLRIFWNIPLGKFAPWVLGLIIGRKSNLVRTK